MKKKDKFITLIVGYGQDGKILKEIDQKENKKIIILSNKKTTRKLEKNISFYNFDISNKKKVFNFLKKLNNLKIFFLATHNISSTQSENIDKFKKNLKTNVQGLTNFLEFMKLNKEKKIRLFYACSSHIFEKTNTIKQNEKTTPLFSSYYGLVKYLGLNICEKFRVKDNLFCSVGILYSHVSRYTNKNFLIKELANKLKKTKSNTIFVKNSSAQMDIMAAKDAVLAMKSIMNLKEADKFIISSGKSVSINDIFKEIKSYYKLSKNIKIKSKTKYIKNSTILLGNNEKLLKETNWTKKINLKGIIKEVLLNE